MITMDVKEHGIGEGFGWRPRGLSLFLRLELEAHASKGNYSLTSADSRLA